MPQLSPVGEEIISVVYRIEEPTIEAVEQQTSRPHSLIEESVDNRLSRRFLSVEHGGKLELTEAGKRAAEASPLTG